jgi:ferredoxin
VTGPPSYLVVGSGASAVTVAAVLAAQPQHRVTVLDLGGRLEDQQQQALQRLSVSDPVGWAPPDLALVSARSAGRGSRGIPQKRAYGSDYPFRDLGQTTGVRGEPADTNLDVVSSAYGGFTTVWGAQVMPFSRSTFDAWPFSWQEMEPHYRAVLDEVPLAGEDDDLAEVFPLLNPRSPLPPLGPRAEDVLARTARHREALRRHGVIVGRARLALRADGCTRCGLCMTGCPYSLIYSAAQTMDWLRRLPNVRYLDRLLVERIGQDGDEAVVRARELGSDRRHEFRADRLFVGAGALGTTRLVLGSLPDPPASLELAESRQFLVPFVSARPVADPRRAGTQDFTLNQFNILVSFDEQARDTSQVHCYPYNPAMLDALPLPLRSGPGAAAAGALVRRLTVGFGYLPSWASPTVRVVPRAVGLDELPEVTLVPDETTPRPPMLRAVMRRLQAAAPRLDLWPLRTHVTLTGAGKSYHFGGAFPHRSSPAEGRTPGTDRWGRLPQWDRVHLVDGSVLPTVASTTFTLTVMANAHRIASEVLAAQHSHPAPVVGVR